MAKATDTVDLVDADWFQVSFGEDNVTLQFINGPSVVYAALAAAEADLAADDIGNQLSMRSEPTAVYTGLIAAGLFVFVRSATVPVDEEHVATLIVTAY